MSTVLFHRMKLNPRERTQIKVIPAAVRKYCYRCHRLVTPNVIITAFLSLPLDICPRCSSKIQHNGNNFEKVNE